MEPFPFTQDEWDRVQEAAAAIVDASSMEDAVLGEARLVELQEVLAQLAGRHGEHPVLLETEADFLNDAAERVRLYERAKALALAHKLPTYTIRISLARVLIDEGRVEQARRELLACRDEVQREADDCERQEWRELLERIS